MISARKICSSKVTKPGSYIVDPTIGGSGVISGVGVASAGVRVGSAVSGTGISVGTSGVAVSAADVGICVGFADTEICVVFGAVGIGATIVGVNAGFVDAGTGAGVCVADMGISACSSSYRSLSQAMASVTSANKQMARAKSAQSPAAVNDGRNLADILHPYTSVKGVYRECAS